MRGSWCAISKQRKEARLLFIPIVIDLSFAALEKGVYPQGAGNVWRRMWKKG
jgi:hypothetical protein